MEQRTEECADEGRPVKPHRSGGGRGIAIVGAGHHSLALAAALAMAMPTVHVGTRRDVDWFGDRQEPKNTGRRAEKDAIALAKAEAKRKRKMAKRATGMPPNARVQAAAEGGRACNDLLGYALTTENK